MIQVAIQRDNDDQITTFEATGHAYAAKPGEDLVCSAVSAILQTACLGITHLVGIPADTTPIKGYLRWNRPANTSTKQKEQLSLILETMLLGLLSVQQGYSKNIQIIDTKER